jgi:hypothetical protein
MMSGAGWKIFLGFPSAPAMNTPSVPCWKPTDVPSAENVIVRSSRTGCPQPTIANSALASASAHRERRDEAMVIPLEEIRILPWSLD